MRVESRKRIRHMADLLGVLPGDRVGEPLTAEALADDATTPNTPVDVATALMTTQHWIRSANVMDMGDFLRDMGLRAQARDLEAVFGAKVCICGGTA